MEQPERPAPEFVNVEGALIIGAGPAGLAVARCLGCNSVPYTIIERADCIASLWQQKTYDRIHLHIPKQYSQLPGMAFPRSYPTYPSGAQFVAYLEEYSRLYHIEPRFNHRVTEARFLEELHRWRVVATVATEESTSSIVYLTRWLVVATGENADPHVPNMNGAADFGGASFHSSEYRNGEQWRGKKVLVVGSGNSGFEVALDLANHGAVASLNVRSPMHVLPRQMLGFSTFGVALKLRSYGVPYFITDALLISYANWVLGDTADYGITRPRMGPLERKDAEGVTPVLDVGTLAKIRSGEIQVVQGVMKLTATGAVLADRSIQEFDAIIWATGFKSSVNKWLTEEDTKIFDRHGHPIKSFPNSWLGDKGLYTAGFTKRGLLGASRDAVAVAAELGQLYKESCLRNHNHQLSTV